MSTLAGQSVGKYKLLERLGRGGMAEVYKAHHPKLDRIVAVKILHSYLAEGEDFLARFEREARAVANLKHAHIVQMYDCDVDNATYYMVMEFIGGGTLQDRMDELKGSSRYMPLGQVVTTLKQVASALDYAHKKGIIHRDIKPSNILMDESGDSFLADFGIARMVSTTQFTSTGALIGTPTYMSPEQSMSLDLTPASDIYSLGVIIYELLTGQAPFAADTPFALIQKHVSEPLPSLCALRPALPSGVEAAVAKALEKEPGKRYQTAGEFAQALAEALPPELIAELDREVTKQIKKKAAVASQPTEKITRAGAPRPEQLPTVAMSKEERAEISGESPPAAAPPPETEPEPPKISAAIPIADSSTRTAWIILLMGVILFAGRFLVEYLVQVANLLEYVPLLPNIELVLGVLGLFVGFWHWLLLRLLGISLKRVQTILLLVVWCVSFLTIGIFTFAINPDKALTWQLAFGLAGLLGGLGTSVILSRAVPHFRLTKVLLLTVLSALYLFLGYCLTTISEPTWADFYSILSAPLRMGLSDLLVGILLAWTISRLIRPWLEPDSPPTLTGRTEWGILLLVFSWMVARFGCALAITLLFRQAGIDPSYSGWSFRNISILCVTGLLNGLLLWLVLRFLKIQMGRRAWLTLTLLWGGGMLLGSLIPALLINVPWAWAVCGGLAAALCGAFTMRLLRSGQHPTGLQKEIITGAGFGVGLALGVLIFDSALSGLASIRQGIFLSTIFSSLSASLASATSALAGGSILISFFFRGEYKTRWLRVLLCALVVGIVALLNDFLYLSLSNSTAYHWVMYIIYGLGCGIGLSLFTKNYKSYLLFGVLASLGFLVGRYLWVGINQTMGISGAVTVFHALLGLGVGVFLALGRRVQWALFLGLTAILAFLLGNYIPYPADQNFLFYLVSLLRFGILGAALGLAFDFFAMLPGKASGKSGQ